MKFYTVDAFSSVAFGGNPSCIMLLEKGMPFPTTHEMFEIAKELGYSETAFVKSVDDDTFNIRFLTLSEEIDLSIGATIGAFTVMSREGLIEDNYNYLCETLGGNIIVHVDGDDVFIEMSGDLSKEDTLDNIYELMGIPRETVIKEKTSNLLEEYMPEPIAASLPDIVMPVLNPAQMQVLGPSMVAFANMDLPDNADTPIFSHDASGLENNSLSNLSIPNKVPAFALQLNNFEEDASVGEYNDDILQDLSEDSNLNPVNLFKSKTAKKPIRKLGLIENVDGEMKVKIGGSGVVLGNGQIFL